MLFDKNTCWNIFDHEAEPEPIWDLMSRGFFKTARLKAMLITLRHPLRTIPIIVGCLRMRITIRKNLLPTAQLQFRRNQPVPTDTPTERR